ncbi:MAG: hypothetical protein ACLPYZ_13405 [Limisphaerales bacterium]
MAKKAAAQNGRADLPVSQDAQQRVPATKKENSLAPSDGVQRFFTNSGGLTAAKVRDYLA